MKMIELVKKNNEELLELLNDLRAELFTLRFKNKTHQQDQTHKIALVRHDIARVLTILKQREKGIVQQQEIDKNKESKLKNQTSNKKTSSKPKRKLFFKNSKKNKGGK